MVLNELSNTGSGNKPIREGLFAKLYLIIFLNFFKPSIARCFSWTIILFLYFSRTIVSPISGTTRDAIDTEFAGEDGQVC